MPTWPFLFFNWCTSVVQVLVTAIGSSEAQTRCSRAKWDMSSLPLEHLASAWESHPSWMYLESLARETSGRLGTSWNVNSQINGDFTLFLFGLAHLDLNTIRSKHRIGFKPSWPFTPNGQNYRDHWSNIKSSVIVVIVSSPRCCHKVRSIETARHQTSVGHLPHFLPNREEHICTASQSTVGLLHTTLTIGAGLGNTRLKCNCPHRAVQNSPF